MKCKKCGYNEEKEFVKIVSRYDSNKVLFKSTKTTIKEAVEEAIKAKINLSGADLSGADLSGSNLSDSDLSESDLSQANLFGVNLSGADLSQANLFKSNLSGADLSQANLFKSNLSGAKTTMCKVNFSSNEKEQAKQFAEGIGR